MKKRKLNDNNVFVGSVSPKRWRTHHDTKELAALLKPQDYPIGGMEYLAPEDRFKT